MSRRRALTDEQVAYAKRRYKRGVRGCGYGAIAKEMGCGESTVRDIINYYVGYAALEIQ